MVVEPRRGYGAAVHTGLDGTRRADLVAVLDGDGSLDAAALPVAGRRGAAPAGPDLAVGRRVPRPGRGVWPWHARAGNAVVAALLRRRGRARARHRPDPRRAPGRRCSALGVADRAFGYPLELLLRAGRAGWRIEEVPVRYRPQGRRPVQGLRLGASAPLRAVRDMGALLLTTR